MAFVRVLVTFCAFVASASAQIAQAPSTNVGTAQGPEADTAFERNDKYKLGPQPAFLQQTSPYGSESGGAPGFVRGDKFVLPAQPTNSSFAPVAERANQELSARIEAAGNTGFVKTNGTNFVLNGKITYFSGSNNYFLILRGYLTDDQVKLFFRLMAGNGLDLIRTWGFLNGGDDPYIRGLAIQPQVGVYNEQSLQRLDLIFSEANANGVRIILPFVNFWADLGGMQFYVDALLGPGQPLEKFYTDPTVKQAYKSYVKKIVTRVNTITGVAYINDPTVFAWELANEPHCNDGYEDSIGVPRGSIVRAWVAEMAAYIRSLDSKHMIATGEEGYLSTGGPGSGWRNDGTKGVDFGLNLQDANIDFGTIHVYPGSWLIPADSVAEFANSFIYSRAQIANAIGKPFILEETGMDVRAYAIYRPDFYTALFSAAQRSDAKAMMPWELVPWHVDPSDSGGYDFGIDDVSYGPVAAAIAYQKNRTAACASGTCPPVTPPCLCFDVPPDDVYTCQQQGGFYGGDCSGKPWLSPGTCDISCGRCTRCPDYDYCKDCTDKAPSSDYTCTQQVGFYGGSCANIPFLGLGTCDASCGRCSKCPPGRGPPICQVNIQVGPVWPAGGTQQGTKMQMYLSSPANNTITAPYNVTLTSSAPYSAAYPWEWQATITPNGLTGSVPGSYATLRPYGGNTANIGTVVIFNDAAALKPTSAKINNVTCGLIVSTYYEELG